MTYTFASALILLILIMDPFGNIPIFASALKHIPAHRRWQVILREHGFAFAILFAFMLVGDAFLKHLGLSSTSLEIAGGVVLFLIAIRMIFPDHSGDNDPVSASNAEPYLVPLAIPLIAGPSALAVVMLLANQQPELLWTWVGALTSAVVISATILVAAVQLKDRLGDKFLIAMERLMGLILVALSVEMLVRGFKGAFLS